MLLLLLLLLNEVWQAKVTRFMQPPSVLLLCVLTSSASSSQPQSTHQALLGNHLHNTTHKHTKRRNNNQTKKSDTAKHCFVCAPKTLQTQQPSRNRVVVAKHAQDSGTTICLVQKAHDHKQKKRDCSTQCSQVVSNPGTDRARRDFTSLIRREVVLSSWCGRNQTNKQSKPANQTQPSLTTKQNSWQHTRLMG